MFSISIRESAVLFLTFCIVSMIFFLEGLRFPLNKHIAFRPSRIRDFLSVGAKNAGQPISPFYSLLDSFSWPEFNQAIDDEDKLLVSHYSAKLLSTLTPYLILEPLVPINETCQPAPLSLPKCKNGTNDKPRKVGLLVQFGFDLDTLEIYLNEVFDIVDKFFLLESTHTYSYLFKKNLLWESARDQARFIKFSRKIVHLILDDADFGFLLNTSTRGMYDAEQFQELSRWQKFLKWNNATNYFEDNDLLGFGDSDEIPSREIIHYLKHCVPQSDPIDVGAWFLFGSVNIAFHTDYPVLKHPFTYGDPTFWSLKTAKSPQERFGRKFPSRNRGTSGSFILGGTHMSDYPYLPNVFAKRLTMSEQRFEFIRKVASYPLFRKNMSLIELEKFYATSNSINYSKRIHNVTDLQEQDLRDRYIPWFYDCNRNRYPGWEGKHDSRVS